MRDQQKKFLLSGIIIIALLLIGSALYAGTTYTVDDDGAPADYTTIQAAINAASVGDIVYVLPGLYTELVEMKPGVDLYGSGPDVTVIDGQKMGIVVSFSGSLDTIISGFTITGSAPYGIDGVGVYCFNSTSPLIITNNVITGNWQGITENFLGKLVIINNTIVKNSHSGIAIQSSDPPQVIKNNIIVDNPHGIFITGMGDSSETEISYNNVWDNTTNYFQSGVGSFTPSPGTGQISKDPLFVDPLNDFHLSVGSPCIDSGEPGLEGLDTDETRNDMGAFGGPGSVRGRGSFSGSGFIFTSIGKIPTSEITQDSRSLSHGLANVSKKIAQDFKIHQYTDSPFGGKLWIHGLFGEDDDVAYYQILVGKWSASNKPPATSDYVFLNDTLTKVNFTINPDGTVSYNYVTLGPKTIATIDNLYQLTKAGYWNHIDLRLIWNTRLWENGKYTLTYKAYNSKLVQVFPETNTLDHLTLIVDNSPVTATIHHVNYIKTNPHYDPNNDGEIPECGIITLTDDQEDLRFTITASHPHGYLRQYILDALYGKNKNGGIIKEEVYVKTSPPYWYGPTDKEFHSSGAAPGALAPWTSCAYQFRLRVWSRTTDGFHYIIWDDFSDHYFINLDDNLCKGDFDEDGDVDGSDLVGFATDFGRSDCLPSL